MENSKTRMDCPRVPFCSFFHSDVDKKREVWPQLIDYSVALDKHIVEKKIPKDVFAGGIGYSFFRAIRSRFFRVPA